MKKFTEIHIKNIKNKDSLDSPEERKRKIKPLNRNCHHNQRLMNVARFAEWTLRMQGKQHPYFF